MSAPRDLAWAAGRIRELEAERLKLLDELARVKRYKSHDWESMGSGYVRCSQCKNYYTSPTRHTYFDPCPGPGVHRWVPSLFGDEEGRPWEYCSRCGLTGTGERECDENYLTECPGFE